MLLFRLLVRSSPGKGKESTATQAKCCCEQFVALVICALLISLLHMYEKYAGELDEDVFSRRSGFKYVMTRAKTGQKDD